MKIPKYVQKLMSRAEFDLMNQKGEIGYTLRIKKESAYMRIDTLREEV